ncbi:MAG TPA: MFS transporter [Acetobacteraceae bacterium]|nr:MFS transporter [Acetobacteraceae bacterium]
MALVPTSAHSIEPADGVPLPQRYWAIISIALGLTLAVLDGAIANVALPTIARDVNASPADSIWVVNAYQLTVTISLLPFASAGEIFGYRRIYRWGLAVFTAASLGCALSDSLGTLTAARIVQGFGAAGIMSVNGALVRFIYPRRLVGRGIGFNATVGSISSAVGPTVAAAILSVANWPWLFAVNLPIGAAALLVAWRALPATPRSRIPFDLQSALLSAVSIGVLIMAIDGFGHGERPVVVAVQLVIAVVVGVVLVMRQMTRTSPLLPVDLLRIPLFAMSVATSICGFMAQGMALVSLPFLLENTLGRNEVQTGLLMTPWPLTVAFIAPFAGRLADRYKVGILSGCGLAVLCGGLALLSAMPADPSGLNIAWRMMICGLGFGFFNTPNNRAIITSAPRSRSGGASGMQATSRLMGQTTGAAVVALVFGVVATHGPLVTLLVSSAIAGVAACVSFLRMVERRTTAAE